MYVESGAQFKLSLFDYLMSRESLKKNFILSVLLNFGQTLIFTNISMEKLFWPANNQEKFFSLFSSINYQQLCINTMS